MNTDRLLSWLLTYAVHSTLFLGLAGLIAGRLARRSPGAAEAVWRFALVAGLFTATLISVSPWKPAAGAWRLGSGPAESAAPSALPSLPPAASGLAVRAVPSTPASMALAVDRFAVRPLAQVASTASVPPPSSATPSMAGAARWRTFALAAWGLGAALLCLGAARAYARLRYRLQGRPRVVAGNLHAQLTQLAAGADLRGVRLTCSSRVPVPLALGLARREICVPPRALAGLTAEQQEGMLAHELAHLARRDPSWLVFTHLLTCVLFFQPLNWIARRRLRELSEMLADEWAVGRTGRPLSLAGCLAEVAGWAFGHRRLPAAAMADRPSHLARRITRLLNGTEGAGRVRRLALSGGLALSLVAVLGVAPVVRSAESEGGSPAAKAREAAGVAPVEGGAAAMAEDRARKECRREGAHASHYHGDGEVDAAMLQASLHESIEDAVQSAMHEVRSSGGHGEHGEHAEEVEDAVDDAVEDAVEAAVEGAMSGIESSFDALDHTSDALDALEGEIDVDVDGNLEREIERGTAELDRLQAQGKLSEAERQELARKMSRMARELQERLQPQIERMSREVARQVERSLGESGEMQRMAADLAKRSADFKPDPEAVQRLSELAKRLAADGKVSAEEAERLGREAKKIAESVKLREPELREMREMAKQHAEMTRKVMAEHRDEIEQARREMKAAIDLEMQGVRQELERSRDELRQRMREERHGRGEVERKERAERKEQSERPERRERDEAPESPVTPPPVH